MNRYRLLFFDHPLVVLSLPVCGQGNGNGLCPLTDSLSNETNRNPTAFLWIPADCMQIKAIIVGQHNMSEETLFDNPLFREKDAEACNRLCMDNSRIDQQWDVSKGTQQIFEKMMVSRQTSADIAN